MLCFAYYKRLLWDSREGLTVVLTNYGLLLPLLLGLGAEGGPTPGYSWGCRPTFGDRKKKVSSNTVLLTLTVVCSFTFIT